MNAIELIRQFLVDRLGVAESAVVPGAALAELGVDSLMLAELMFEAEDRLGIEIPSDQTPPKSVADMVAVIESLVPSKTE
ncbi:acyl carrier protein [Hydrogenophaga sp. YM1]|jgi:acyl carrier protein|uniref:Acyl carrier protein n=1 Tax=Hydrogenophaga borbori TaxID=2294117 RepID=A0A372EN68_9BURK|nr:MULTISPECIES: phosphopantetheine-binding protein [Hydrogenophaga]NCT96360.1 acyl carrier protein [Comamonadaceae bacterium]QRR36130.1 acyl carrier protein [Hydrogenophaga sp. YM1]RFP81117.1 acyl carrier protein [Hydrogenophaga borbori]WQB85667.1 phosphopantetheine-binding protein [Hydrogenophaga sp. SNF1]